MGHTHLTSFSIQEALYMMVQVMALGCQFDGQQAGCGYCDKAERRGYSALNKAIPWLSMTEFQVYRQGQSTLDGDWIDCSCDGEGVVMWNGEVEKKKDQEVELKKLGQDWPGEYRQDLIQVTILYFNPLCEPPNSHNFCIDHYQMNARSPYS